MLHLPRLSLPKGCEGATLPQLPSFFFFHCTLLHRNFLLCSVCAHAVWIKILI